MPETHSRRNPPTKDFLLLSILGLFCCFPFGIAALIFTFKTRDANNYGDRVRAEKSSRMAFILGITSVIVGLVLMFFSTTIHFLVISQASKNP